MQGLGVFFDESGGDGPSDRHYLLAIVMHDRSESIADPIESYESALRAKGLPDIPFHASPLMNGKDMYSGLDPGTRKALLGSFRVFFRHTPVRCRTFAYATRQFASLERLGGDGQAALPRRPSASAPKDATSSAPSSVHFGMLGTAIMPQARQRVPRPRQSRKPHGPDPHAKRIRPGRPQPRPPGCPRGGRAAGEPGGRHDAGVLCPQDVLLRLKGPSPCVRYRVPLVCSAAPSLYPGSLRPAGWGPVFSVSFGTPGAGHIVYAGKQHLGYWLLRICEGLLIIGSAVQGAFCPMRLNRSLKCLLYGL